MMRMVMLSVLLLSGACGCAQRVYFTHQLRSEYNLGDNELRQLQYYVSGYVVLHRQLSSTETEVTPGHRLKVVKDQLLEEVYIKPGTPGIAVETTDSSLGISFEEGSHLFFGSDEKNRPAAGGRYGVFAKEWNGSQGKVEYGGKEYWVNTGFVYLMVDLKGLNKFKRVWRNAPGRRLD